MKLRMFVIEEDKPLPNDPQSNKLKNIYSQSGCMILVINTMKIVGI